MQCACRSISRHGIFALRACKTSARGKLRSHFINLPFPFGKWRKIENCSPSVPSHEFVSTLSFSSPFEIYLHFLCGRRSRLARSRHTVSDQERKKQREEENGARDWRINAQNTQEYEQTYKSEFINSMPERGPQTLWQPAYRMEACACFCTHLSMCRLRRGR